MQEPSNIANNVTIRELNEMLGPGSKTAMAALSNRLGESQKPEGERICYDPYAVYFINKEFLDRAIHNRDKVVALRLKKDMIHPKRPYSSWRD